MDSILQNMDREKRDRIINAAVEEFSLYPYEKASTNNIVKNANISKGLLFHYFGSKHDLYEKLIEFVVQTLFREITSQIDWAKTDIFDRIKSLVLVKVKIGRTYPRMFDFMIKVLTEKKVNSIEDVKNLYEKCGVDLSSVLGDIYTKNTDFSLFRDMQTIDKSMNIIRWTLEKYATERLLELGDQAIVDFEKMSLELDDYIHILKKAFYD